MKKLATEARYSTNACGAGGQAEKSRGVSRIFCAFSTHLRGLFIRRLVLILIRRFGIFAYTVYVLFNSIRVVRIRALYREKILSV